MDQVAGNPFGGIFDFEQIKWYKVHKYSIMKWPEPVTEFKNLQEVSDYLAEKYPFNTKSYPAMKGLVRKTQIQRFKAKHYFMQMMVTLRYVSMASIGKATFDDEYGMLTRDEVGRFAINLLLLMREYGECPVTFDNFCLKQRENLFELKKRKRKVNHLSGFTHRVAELASFYALTDQKARKEVVVDPIFSGPLLFSSVFLIFRKFYTKPLSAEEEWKTFLNFLPTLKRRK